MYFKFKNTEIKISFTFFALILLFSATQDFRMYLLTLIAGLMHELVHLFFIYKFSSAPKKIVVSLFGANIVRHSHTTLKISEEILINVSAPIFNLLCGLTINFLVKNKTDLINEFAIINIILGFFNLLPFYNLDGGNALRNILQLKYEENITERIMTFTSVIITFAFSISSFLVLLNFNSNFSLFIITMYFLLSLLFKKR